MPRWSARPIPSAAPSSRRSSCCSPDTRPSAALEAEIQAHVRGRLAPYEYPKEIEFIDALPMTTTGKVQRRVLRLQEEARKKALMEGRALMALPDRPRASASCSRTKSMRGPTRRCRRPRRLSYVAVLVNAEDKAREHAHVVGAVPAATARCRRRSMPSTSRVDLVGAFACAGSATPSSRPTRSSGPALADGPFADAGVAARAAGMAVRRFPGAPSSPRMRSSSRRRRCRPAARSRACSTATTWSARTSATAWPRRSPISACIPTASAASWCTTAACRVTRAAACCSGCSNSRPTA